MANKLKALLVSNDTQPDEIQMCKFGQLNPGEIFKYKDMIYISCIAYGPDGLATHAALSLDSNSINCVLVNDLLVEKLNGLLIVTPDKKEIG